MWVRGAVGAALVALIACTGSAGAQLPAPLVHLRSVDPTIHQEMRYASADNATGRPLPGYAATECMLLADVAAALSRVQRDLAASGFSLKVYDCYRPRRANAALAAWVMKDDGSQRTRAWNPRIDRHRLRELGYIAGVSGHSRGASVDVTLVRMKPDASSSPPAAAVEVPCHESPVERSAYPSLDMGTSFDCFDVRSHTQAAGLTPAQREARKILHEAMGRHGFRGYRREWWHFEFATSGGGGRSFEIDVVPYR